MKESESRIHQVKKMIRRWIPSAILLSNDSNNNNSDLVIE